MIELITVVMILSVLACVAIPRMNLAAVSGARADAVVRRVVTDLRRTRAQAIQEAACNPAGSALIMTGSAPYKGYEIIRLSDSAVVAACEIPADVQCSGGQKFAFGPLGNLKTGSDTQLQISTEDKVYLVEVLSTTGAVRWTRQGG